VCPFRRAFFPGRYSRTAIVAGAGTRHAAGSGVSPGASRRPALAQAPTSGLIYVRSARLGRPSPSVVAPSLIPAPNSENSLARRTLPTTFAPAEESPAGSWWPISRWRHGDMPRSGEINSKRVGVLGRVITTEAKPNRASSQRLWTTNPAEIACGLALSQSKLATLLGFSPLPDNVASGDVGQNSLRTTTEDPHRNASRSGGRATEVAPSGD